MELSLPSILSQTKFDKKAILSLVGAVVAVVICVYVVASNTIFSPISPDEQSRIRAAIDGESGELFEEYRVKDGVTLPWKNPKTGKNTVWPAEKCYWNKDGTAKITPTYVLLNDLVGKPGPTLCPDCGHVVVGHNPMPPQDLIIAAAKKAGK